MPASLKLLKANSFCDRDYNGPRTARVAAILSGYTPNTATTGDIFTVNDQAAEVAIAIAGVGPGDAFPGTTNNNCACIGVRAQPTEGTNWIVLWDFDRPTGFTIGNGIVNSLYKVYEQKTFIDVQRVRLPHVASGNTIQVGYEDATDADNTIKPQTATVRVRKPALLAVLAGTFNQKPTYLDGSTVTEIGSMAGRVNSTPWQGWARGFMLFSGSEISQDPGQTLRRVQFTVISLIDEDWSEYIVVEHPSGIVPAFSAAQLTAVAGGYPLKTEGETSSDGKGYIRPTVQFHATDPCRDKNGIVRFGPYPEVDFNKVFSAVVSL